MDQLKSNMSTIKLFIEMREYEEKQAGEVNLIEFIEQKYPEIEKEQIIVIIVWYINFDFNKITFYLTQRQKYKQISSLLNLSQSVQFEESTETTEQPKMRLDDMLCRLQMKSAIICNPFVPLTYGFQQNIYITLCYLTQTNVGCWEGETKNAFLESPELSMLMFESFIKQPLFVIHLLWKRVLHGVVIEDDEMALAVFGMMNEFVSIYPMFKHSLFNLALAYDSVTDGAQQAFVSSFK